MDKIINGIKQVGAKIKAFAMKIAKMIAFFFKNPIGHIVFWVLVVAILGLILYVVLNVIYKGLAKILNMEAGASQYNEDAEYLKNLTESGYAELLNANELIEYYAFEYSVLMDAARFMEENGTETINKRHIEPVNLEKINASDAAELWSLLASQGLCTPSQKTDAVTNRIEDIVANGGGEMGEPLPDEEDVEEETHYDEQDKNEEDEDSESGDSVSGDSAEGNKYNNGFIDLNKFTKEYSDENLFYEAAYNEYSEELSLVPFLEIERYDDIVTYYVETISRKVYDYQKEGWESGIPQDQFDKLLGTNRFEASYGVPDSEIEVPAVNTHTFEKTGGGYRKGINQSYEGDEAAAEWIKNNLFPLMYNKRLNQSNKRIFNDKKRDPNFYPYSSDKLGLYDDYKARAAFHETDRVIEIYHIPLKLLLERYLPNAALLTSWRALNKNDEKAGDDVVEQIEKIYSEACLKDEENPGEEYLVKDVWEMSVKANDETAPNVFMARVGKTLSSQKTANEEYIYGGDTKLFFNHYNPLFDSRQLAKNAEENEGGNAEGGNAGNENNNGQEGNQGEGQGGENSQEPGGNLNQGTESNDTEGPGSSSSAKQSFSSTDIKEDLIDDIKLIITQYAEDARKAIPESVYNKIIEDATREAKITNESHTCESNEYVTIYTPLEDGSYLADCKANTVEELHTHYGVPGSDETSKKIIAEKHKHVGSDNPYGSQYKDCFVPFIKFSYSLDEETGIRTTAAIIYDYNMETYYTYGVKGKIIKDFLSITNINTCAFFEAGVLHCTTPRHWEFSFGGVKNSTEKWVVEDLYEGLELLISGVEVPYSYKDEKGEIQSGTLNFSVEDLIEGSVDDYLYLVGDKSGKKRITSRNFVDIGIIKYPKMSGGHRQYEEIHPTPNASIKDDEMDTKFCKQFGLDKGNSRYKDGETVYIGKSLINLKEEGFQEDEIIEIDDEELMAEMARNVNRVASETLRALGITPLNIGGVTQPIYTKNFYAVEPVKRSISPITQEIWDKMCNVYLVKGAKTWSAVKKMNNKISISGEFNNRDSFLNVISKNPNIKGIQDWDCFTKASWRGKLFAPVFAGKDDTVSKARETDVLYILSEWEEASAGGVAAADYYIRDLYKLINYCKGIKDPENPESETFLLEPVKRSDGTPYVRNESYSFIPVAEEILGFEEGTAEVAFWEDRIVHTREDPIDESTENYLRSRRPLLTEQKVEYNLYDECTNAAGGHSAYAFWPYGNQLSRSVYAIEANSCQKSVDKILAESNGWGGYSEVHHAADLQGRTIAKKLWQVVDEMSNMITLETNGDAGGWDSDLKIKEGSADMGGNGTAIYFTEVPITIKIRNLDMKFLGSVAATYGFEYMRRAYTYRNVRKGTEELREQIRKELKWTEIRSVLPGIVQEVNGNGGSGFFVRVKHADGVVTSYLHLKRYPVVQEGQYVGAGTLLGYEGTTGNSNGFHCHFSLSINGKNVNPIEYVYPFFTPFYNEEKAAEEGYKFESEYMSPARTVFAPGQKLYDGFVPKEDTVEMDENGYIKIKNYVPKKAVLTDCNDLYTKKDEVEYPKFPTKNVNIMLGGSSFKDKLESNPNYFDFKFMKQVKLNKRKIKGAENIQVDESSITADDLLNKESGDSSGDKTSGETANTPM